ncbi:MAG: hypothetical protein OEX19_01985 [Gammaproteobacteria bacterium]|nr:hypothetical protein [Gammaproteobacteria bacterium]
MPQILLAAKSESNQKSRCYVRIEGTVAEHEQIWIWEHFFCMAINTLGKSTEADRLLLTLGTWARETTRIMQNQAKTLEHGLIPPINQEISLHSNPDDMNEVYFIETQSIEGSWPSVRIRLPDFFTPQRLENSVIGLAQHFLNENELFYRELPLHILLIQKFFTETLPFTARESVTQAPAFAMNTALEFFSPTQKEG